MRNVDLVFRTVGERTSALALELAQKYIRPEQTYVFENVRPFSETVRRMLTIQHDGRYVVHMDADCLVLEDLRPFLDFIDFPYVDSYVCDRFRGSIHCGVHITRTDVVRQMAKTPPPTNDLSYVLRPESSLRNLALRELDHTKAFKSFRILHDWFQSYEDVYAKYALRELRSRTPTQRIRLEVATRHWTDESDYFIARAAMRHAERSVPLSASPQEVERYIAALPQIAAEEVPKLGLAPQGELTMDEVGSALDRNPRLFRPADAPKVFGIGLSRTGTRSLTGALQILGFDTLHYPTDDRTLANLVAGNYRFDVLEHFDGLTDITAAPFFAQLDREFPRSKFVLTVRADRDAWLKSCSNHWSGRSAYETADTPERRTHMEIRRLLRAATYGCYDYQPERFSWVHDQHVHSVMEYFKNRPEDLLVLDICAGDSWDKLCAFLNRPIPEEPFPHKGGALSAKMNTLEMRD